MERKKQTREAKRYASLACQIQDIRGYSLKATAILLNISQPQLTRLINGEREGIGAERINDARLRVGVDPSYFFDDYEGEANYSEYIIPLYTDLRSVLLYHLDTKNFTPSVFDEILRASIEAGEIVSRWVDRDMARMRAIEEVASQNKKAKEQYFRLLAQDRARLYQDILNLSNRGMRLSIRLTKAKTRNEKGKKRIETEVAKTTFELFKSGQKIVERILLLIAEDPDLPAGSDMFPVDSPNYRFLRQRKLK